jgi:hypothetical protein
MTKNMDRSVDMLLAYRNATVKLLESLSMEALNTIPPGFNNNLIWNFGHVIISQQTLCYLNAGLKPVVDESYIARYRRGSKPGDPADQAEFQLLKKISETALLQFGRDLAADLFSRFNPFMTSYGIEIVNVGDLLRLLLFHEGLHMGYCMALKRALGNRSNRSL